MAHHRLDFTKLYVAKVVEKQLATIGPNQPSSVASVQREDIINRVLDQLPHEHRVFRTINTLPKEVFIDLPVDCQLYISQLVQLTLQEQIGSTTREALTSLHNASSRSHNAVDKPPTEQKIAS